MTEIVKYNLLNSMRKSNGGIIMKKLIRTANDAQAPIVKACYVDVASIWKRAQHKSNVGCDLNCRVLKALTPTAEKIR